MMDLFQNPSSVKSSKFQAAIWAAKLVLMSIGVISTLVLLKVAIVPYTFHLVLSTLPRLWISARSWLSLPFIYIIVNFIIITIAASNFHHKSTSFSDSPPPSLPKHTDTITTISETVTHPTEPENQSNEPREEEKEIEEEEEEVKDLDLSFKKFIADSSREDSDDKGDDTVESFNKFITDSSIEKCTNDYPLLDSDDKGDDTMEATWKAIMEGQGKSMKPQLKKSDTWGARITKAEPFHDNVEGCDDDDHVAWAQRELKKSETFNDRVSLRRDKSMSPEELNRRADDFIKKFNNQMKLQRLESYQRFMEMVNRGV